MGTVGLGSLPWGTEELRGGKVRGPESAGWGREGHPRPGSSFIQGPASQDAGQVSTGQQVTAPGWNGLQGTVWSVPHLMTRPPFQPASCVQLPAGSDLASPGEWCCPQ